MPLARVSLWAPVVLWAGLIFALSSIPSLSTDLGLWDLVLRKSAHLAEYAILGALLARALARPVRDRDGGVWREPLVALALGSAYALTDEIHQTFVAGRHGAPLDWIIDTAGVAAGVLLVVRATR